MSSLDLHTAGTPLDHSPAAWVPQGLPFSAAPVLLQVSTQNWLLCLPPPPGSTLLNLDSVEGQSVWEWKGGIFPQPPPWSCWGFIQQVPKTGPPPGKRAGNSHRPREQASAWGLEPGHGHSGVGVWFPDWVPSKTPGQLRAGV